MENLRKMRGIMGDEKCAELFADGELEKNARHYGRLRTYEKCAVLWQIDN
jgi:hypothetical protein